VCRAGMLTIDHFMEVLRVFNIGWFHKFLKI
jgi:hypothetical protein